MKVKEIAEIIEEAVPLCLQEGYDNAGLIIGDPEDEINSALLCVDITEEVLDEAEALGIRLVISHHPLIFHPLKQLTGSTNVQSMVIRAIKSGMALYACHTNLDSVHGGMSFRLGELLGLKDMELLDVQDAAEKAGFGVIGNLPETMHPEDFLIKVKERLNIASIRYSDPVNDKISKVALCTGAGGSLAGLATAKGADMYLSSEFRHNDFIDARGRIMIADIGHFESEYCAIELLFDIITKKITTFALHKSTKTRNPVNYIV